MKQFLLFIGLEYYPSEAMNDFIDDFDTIEEAREKVKKILCKDWQENFPHDSWEEYITYFFSREWIQIFCCKTREIVYFGNSKNPILP